MRTQDNTARLLPDAPVAPIVKADPLAKILQKVASAAKKDANAFLKHSEVPFGGE